MPTEWPWLSQPLLVLSAWNVSRWYSDFIARRLCDALTLLVFDSTIDKAEDSSGEAKRHHRKGRAGGLKGGKAKAERLTPEQRREIASAAARVRWHRFDGRTWGK